MYQSKNDVKQAAFNLDQYLVKSVIDGTTISLRYLIEFDTLLGKRKQRVRNGELPYECFDVLEIVGGCVPIYDFMQATVVKNLKRENIRSGGRYEYTLQAGKLLTVWEIRVDTEGVTIYGGWTTPDGREVGDSFYLNEIEFISNKETTQ